jgi:hypothetical protein
MSRSDSPSPSPAAARRAQPSDATLVNAFLWPWVTLGITMPGGVHAVDLYSADPEKLARGYQPEVSLDGQCTWYFLSPLRPKSPHDPRKVRTVADGTGCWRSDSGVKNVIDCLDGARHVGYRQNFSFMRRDAAGADARSGWAMTEFHLHHSYDEHGHGGKVEGLVLCKMYRNRNRRIHGGSDDVVPGVSPCAEKTFSCGKSQPIGHDYSKAKNSDGGATATGTIAPPLLNSMVAGDDKVSGATTTTTAPPLGHKGNPVEVDNEDLLTWSPARKKMRAAGAGAESSEAASTVSNPTPDQVRCPRCGFHFTTMQSSRS